jgi:hypothetical protein
MEKYLFNLAIQFGQLNPLEATLGYFKAFLKSFPFRTLLSKVYTTPL